MQHTHTAPCRPLGPFDSVTLGLKVLWSECCWMLQASLRRFELRQLQRRLQEEYAALGRDAYEQADSGPEHTRSQINFLLEEIAFLEDERRRRRRDLVSRRSRSLGLSSPTECKE